MTWGEFGRKTSTPNRRGFYPGYAFERLAMMHARLFILFALLLGAATPSLAQTFPTHGVTIISPYQAGGTSDIIARALAQKLGETWSQPVVVENRPDADTAGQISSVFP
jgi:tripartite-type tricarboxylate transporter receptor subunit TctC